jgi:hypothetical protein
VDEEQILIFWIFLKKFEPQTINQLVFKLKQIVLTYGRYRSKLHSTPHQREQTVPAASRSVELLLEPALCAKESVFLKLCLFVSSFEKWINKLTEAWESLVSRVKNNCLKQKVRVKNLLSTSCR